jgi:hypothetical protein
VLKRFIAVAMFTSVCLCFEIPGAAQKGETFKARLAPVPMDASMRQNVTGSGSATAVLAGNKLSITVTFTGLGGAATAARLHQGVATGVRGSPFHDLTISKATSGTLSAAFDLTPEQAENLKKGRVYIQIYSEKAPDGNLWGWLLR